MWDVSHIGCMLDIVENLITDIEHFMNETGMSASAFGKGAVNDAHFVPNLRDGREPKFSTIARVRAFMEKETDAAA